MRGVEGGGRGEEGREEGEGRWRKEMPEGGGWGRNREGEK